MNRPARILVGVFIDTPARIANAALNLAMPPTPRHVLEAENKRLRERNRALEWDLIRLSKITDQLAADVYETTASKSKNGPALIAEECARFRNDLGSLKSLDDLRYALGGEA